MRTITGVAVLILLLMAGVASGALYERTNVQVTLTGPQAATIAGVLRDAGADLPNAEMDSVRIFRDSDNNIIAKIVRRRVAPEGSPISGAWYKEEE